MEIFSTIPVDNCYFTSKINYKLKPIFGPPRENLPEHVTNMKITVTLKY